MLDYTKTCGRGRNARSCFALLAAGAVVVSVPQAAAAGGTRAGTVINNTATASYDEGGPTITVDSNISTLRVDELLDTVVTWTNPSDVPTTPNATAQVLSFQVTNTGNGAEAFSLATISTIGGDQYDPTVTAIVIDNGNGTYEPGVDTVYLAGTNDPVLNPDQSITVFVISTTPAGVSDGNRGGVQLTAAAKTGTGAPGTSFAGQGEGGGNAIVGTTGGDGSDNGYYRVAAATVALAKSAVVLNPFGGTDAVPGATITYTIVATVTGTGTLNNLTINDTAPAGTTYKPGSMTLGGTGLTDAADADAGRLTGSAIAVALGAVPGGQSRTVTFQVTIN